MFRKRSTFMVLMVAMATSLALHLTIMATHFVMPAPKKIPATEPLEIVLVNQKTKSAPSKAEVLAQVDLDGGGNTDGQHRAKSPLPGSPSEVMPELEQTLEQQRQLEARAEQMMTQLRSQQKINVDDKIGKAQDESPGSDTQDLKKKAAQLTGQAAQISKEWNEYQSKPRKTFVGARAKQTSVAFWVDAWAQKVERVGTLAYPVDTSGKKLYGRLRVTAEIGLDGNILSKSVETSSGNPLLDQAALRILDRAAPFPRLPIDMVDDTGKKATVLVIVRTWIFSKSDGSFGID